MGDRGFEGTRNQQGRDAAERGTVAQYLSSIALLVSVIVAVLIGALAGLIGYSFNAGTEVAIAIGMAAALAALASLILVVVRHVNRTWDRRGHDKVVMAQPIRNREAWIFESPLA